MVHGQPIKSSTFGVIRDGASLKIVDLSTVDESALVIHDAHDPDPSYAFALSRLSGSDLEHTPIGIFRNVERPGYSAMVNDQLSSIIASQGEGDIEKLLNSGDTWIVD